MLGEDKAEDRLRELLRDPRWSLPKWRDPQQRIRRAARRQRLRITGMAAGVTAAVIAVAVPVGLGASGPTPGPAGHRPAGPTVYVAYVHGCAHPLGACNFHSSAAAEVIPISTATNKAGNPVKVGEGPSTVNGT